MWFPHISKKRLQFNLARFDYFLNFKLLTMDDLLKKIMAGVDQDRDIVPKHTKRTSEEETAFMRLDKDEPTKKAKLDEKVEDAVDEEGKGVKDEEKPNHPEATELENEQDNQNKEDERHWHEPHH